MNPDWSKNIPRHRTHHLRVGFGFVAIPLFMLGVIAYFAGFHRAPPPVTRNGMGMGTFLAVTLPHAASGRLESAFSLATNRLESLENMMSRYRPGSEVSRINALSGLDAQALSPETYEVLQHASYFHRLSLGAFDITVGPLMAAWGFNRGRASAEYPDERVLADALEHVGCGRLFLSDQAAFLEEGMEIDLGGIAKGYAVDRILSDIAGLGLTNALVNLGGNIRALGRPSAKLPWRISVRNPFKADEPLGVLNLESGMALATSGNYERFVVINGERVAHIMDPRSGRPVRGIAGVTVLAPTALEADALSTALFVLGPEAGAALIRRLPGRAALFVPDRQPAEAMATAGFLERFTPNPTAAAKVERLD